MTWEEDFLSDEIKLFDDAGAYCGSVRPLGGSWQVVRNEAVVAVRPDKGSAMSALSLLACTHDRLTEDGICRRCGLDRRGI